MEDLIGIGKTMNIESRSKPLGCTMTTNIQATMSTFFDVADPSNFGEW
jgi:hypothetical protein